MKQSFAFALIALSLCFCQQFSRAEAVSIFDGQTLNGWEGDKETWRCENGEIVGGSLKRRQTHNDFLATVKSFENFELRLKIKLTGTEGFINSGIQIRSKRVPNFEVSGYQADYGDGWYGGLYDEARRNKVLSMPPKDVQQKIIKRDDWNDYRIRAEGPRIQLWLNGTQTVDYTETADNIPQSGIIAIQIHGGATAEVHVKDVFIEELPASPAKVSAAVKPPLDRMTEALKPTSVIPPFENGKFAMRQGEVAVFTGPENVVIEQRSGWLETALAKQNKDLAPAFRHMGWEGDTVYRQNRMENYGTWKENFDAVDATMIFAWFGQMEALDSTKTPADFEAAYAALLDTFAKRTPRIVVISPAPFEKPASSLVPDNTPKNSVVQQHVEIARKLAQARGYAFVDVFTPLSKRGAEAAKLTRDGIHYTPEGTQEVAVLIAQALGSAPISAADEPLRAEIIEKNRVWFDCWRCMNWAFAYGDRTTQPFAKATDKHPPFVTELTKFRPLVTNADARVNAIAQSKQPPASPAPDAPPTPPAAQSPEEELKNFTIYPGMKVSLFADETIGMIKPIQIRWDERGRLWVLCIPSYPQLQPGQRANDYLLILEDTDGDGKADKVTRFAEGLTMPMGFEFGEGGVYICESTQLTHWKDTDGDGKADYRRVVLSGFGTGDTHQMINSLHWEPDGYLWFTQGYHIWSYIETPHGISELNRSGLWRFNPRTMKLDGYFNESTAGLNSWGVVFDEYGQVFHGGGANYCLYYSVPGMINTLHPLAYKDNFCVSRGKSMEPEFLHSRHLPDDLQGVLMKSTYFTSQISLYRIADDGAGFKSTALTDLIASKSNDFRPVESRVGPDGAIYVCDWLNTIIGHYQASYRDPRRDRTHGRIWKVTAENRPLLQKSALEKMSVTELLEQLRAPERWTRDQARRLLYNMKKEDVIPATDAWVAKLDPKSSDYEKLLYEVTGVYSAHEEPRATLVENFLKSSDFRFRCWGTRMLGYWPKAVDALAALNRSIADEHPRVRLEAIVAASYVGGVEALKVATLALEKPRDFYVDYALTQCIFALQPAWQPALANGTLDFGQRTHALIHVLRTAAGPQSIAQIRKLISEKRVNGDARDDLLAALAEIGAPEDLRFVLDEGASSPRVLAALSTAARIRKLAPGGDLNAEVEKLSASKDGAVRAAANQLAAAWQLKNQASRLLATAQDEKASTAERVAAIESYAKLVGNDAASALAGLLAAKESEVRLGAIAAVARLKPDQAAGRAAELLGEIKSLEDAAPLMLPFLTQNGGPEALAKGISEKKPTADSAKLALQWMAKYGHGDTVLLDALNSAAGLNIDRKEYSAELVAKLVEDAKTRGDAKRGEKLFRSQDYSCTNCHKVGNDGATIGPELTSVARAMTPELIVEAVLWPKRQVKEGYLLTLITTKDGRRFQGMKSAETNTTLTLRDVAGGPPQVFSKVEIQKRNDAGTIMPDGLTDRSSRDELADLLRFLMELGK